MKNFQQEDHEGREEAQPLLRDLCDLPVKKVP
jgi:hypothetical protein